MKELLKRPQVMVQAQKDFKGYPWYGEIGIFILAFCVAQIAGGILMTPFTVIMMFGDKDYLAAIAAQDAQAISEVTMRIASSPVMSLISLFSFISIILFCLLFYKLIGKRKVYTLGFVKKGMFKEYGIGLLVGIAMFSIPTLLCAAIGGLKLSLNVGAPLMLILFFLGFMIQGMGEEVLCRGSLMVSLSRRYSVLAAIIINSIVFACLHLGNGGLSNPVTFVIAMLNLFLFGVVASIYFIKTGNIWGVGALHTIWNYMQGNFFGISVSGMSTLPSVFEVTINEDFYLLNGGAFGMEGGLLVTLTLVISIVFLVMLPGRDPLEGCFEQEEAEVSELAAEASAAEAPAQSEEVAAAEVPAQSEEVVAAEVPAQSDEA